LRRSKPSAYSTSYFVILLLVGLSNEINTTCGCPSVTEVGFAKKYMEFTGGCVCGGTRYVLKSRPFALVDCHCIDCRRSVGAPYVQWGSVPRKDLVVTKSEPRKIPYANRIRSFAACCGTHLFFEDSKESDTIDVTISSLDDPTPFAPQKAIFLEDKLPWVVIDESIPSFETVPKKRPND
jgi:hypothetical protein